MTVVILRKLDLSDVVPLGDFCSKQAKSQVRKFRLQKRESMQVMNKLSVLNMEAKVDTEDNSQDHISCSGL